MNLDSWLVIAGGLAVAVLVLILGVVALMCLASREGPRARAKQENARAKRQEASDERRAKRQEVSDERDEVRAKRRKTRAEREERARKARN